MKKNLIITVQAILLCWVVSTVWASLSGCSNEFIELGPDDADVTQDTPADEADTADDTVEEVEAEPEAEVEDAGADEAEPEDTVEPEDVAEIEDVVEEVEADAGTTTCRDFESLPDTCLGREWLESGAPSGHYVCAFGRSAGGSLELPDGLTTAPITIDVWFQVFDGSWPAGWVIGPMMFSPPADLYVHRDTVDWVWTMGWIHLTVAYVPGAWVSDPSVRTVHVTTTFEAVPLPAVTLEQDVDLFTPAYFDPTTFAFGNVRIDDLCVTQ